MPFRICTVGCGSMATEAHGPSYAHYAAERPDTELCACCDLDAAKAAVFRSAFGFARSYTDIVSMLDGERPDAVCLVAPVARTCELSCQILAMGYPLLVEKPPGLNVTETDRIIAAADASGATTQVAFNRRFMPIVRRLRELLLGSIGASGIRHIHGEVTRFGRTDADFSTTAIHAIDMMRFLSGSDYRRIYVQYQELPHFGPGVANYHLAADMESGATVQVDFCPVAGDIVERITAYGDNRTFTLRLPVWASRDVPGILQQFERNVLLLDESCHAASRGDMIVANGFYGENAAFFDAIRSGGSTECDVRGARQSVEVAQCLRERRDVYQAPGA